MSRSRLEAFTDGMIAVLITILVLDLRAPAGRGLHDLHPLLPKIAVYLMSFVFLAIYWNNHHHLMHVVERIGGGVMWANAHLLFWLSLTPVTTSWLGSHLGDSAPAAAYGVVLLGAAVAFTILVRCLLPLHAADSQLARAVGRDSKGKLSLVAYVAGIAVAPFVPWLSIAIYVGVALVWLVPDRRIERVITPA